MRWLSILALSIALSTAAHTSAAELPEPYASIKVLPFDNDSHFINSSQLEDCFRENHIETVIEVGSWLGGSTRFFAQHAQGKVYAVDTWLGSTDELWMMNDHRTPNMYQHFLSNVIHAGLTDKIIPVRMRSLEAAHALDIQADLIYIDASHDEASVFSDIIAWSSHLNEGGILCGDDWLTMGSVKRAVIRAAETLNKEIVVSENFWRFR